MGRYNQFKVKELESNLEVILENQTRLDPVYYRMILSSLSSKQISNNLELLSNYMPAELLINFISSEHISDNYMFFLKRLNNPKKNLNYLNVDNLTENQIIDFQIFGLTIDEIAQRMSIQAICDNIDFLLDQNIPIGQTIAKIICEYALLLKTDDFGEVINYAERITGDDFKKMLISLVKSKHEPKNIQKLAKACQNYAKLYDYYNLFNVFTNIKYADNVLDYLSCKFLSENLNVIDRLGINKNKVLCAVNCNNVVEKLLESGFDTLSIIDRLTERSILDYKDFFVKRGFNTDRIFS